MKRKRILDDRPESPVVTPKKARPDAPAQNGSSKKKSHHHDTNGSSKRQDIGNNNEPNKLRTPTKSQKGRGAEISNGSLSLPLREHSPEGQGLKDDSEESEEQDETPVVTPSRKRGRPPKIREPANTNETTSTKAGTPRVRLGSEVVEDDNLEQSPTKQPTGRPRGRPRKDRNKRTPSPENLPPHEHYFFQNRPGGGKTSDHTLSSLSLLSHDEYFRAIASFKDPHEDELEFLYDLHCKSFEQWKFELEEGFNVCLYGWGSKRRLLLSFAESLQLDPNMSEATVVVVNGYTQGITIRDILSTLASAIPSLANQKLGAQPQDMLERIAKALATHRGKIVLVIHSIDGQALRRGIVQSVLASLAALESVEIIASADSPNYALMWDSVLASRFNFAHHDATTFVPFEAELGASDGGIVESANSLLGRYGRAISGKEGVIFVLRSLTENARRLYALLVAELLSLADTTGDDEAGGVGQSLDHDNEEQDLEDELGGFHQKTQSKQKGKTTTVKASGLEYSMFYRKAMSQLIATNEVAFRTMLKEFYDHQMLISRKDVLGAEYLSVPFRREECQAILEDLVVD